MMPLFAPSLIIYEKKPCWESELKRRLPEQKLLIRPYRSAPDVLSLGRRAPGSVVVADLAVGAAEVLRLLRGLSMMPAALFPVVIGSVEMADLEWPVRDLGAVAFLTDRMHGNVLADVCRRILFAETRALG
jgi:hypothetical protein